MLQTMMVELRRRDVDDDGRPVPDEEVDDT
jgi:hypothetical protein